MRCSRATHLLQLYIDKQLPLEKMHALETHLSGCPDCQRELAFLEMIDHALTNIESVQEPPDMTANIMRRVALSRLDSIRAADLAEARAKRRDEHKEASFVLLRPSFLELVAVVVLATMTTFGIFMQQPALHALLPFASGHDPVAPLLTTIMSLLSSVNSNTLMLAFWIIGTVLGVWITLLLAGSEMRNQWLKAMMDRLPVW
jgi:anti-sigma factor RsiW